MKAIGFDLIVAESHTYVFSSESSRVPDVDLEDSTAFSGRPHSISHRRLPLFLEVLLRKVCLLWAFLLASATCESITTGYSEGNNSVDKSTITLFIIIRQFISLIPSCRGQSCLTAAGFCRSGFINPVSRSRVE